MFHQIFKKTENQNAFLAELIVGYCIGELKKILKKIGQNEISVIDVNNARICVTKNCKICNESSDMYNKKTVIDVTSARNCIT